MVKIKKSHTKSGITVVTERIEAVRSFSLGFWVVVGSRNESDEEKGISHVIEHTLFKGTKKRNAKQIARALESKGAALDAFTSKEITCYYSRGLDMHLGLAADVISDLVTNPLFPEKELNKEMDVIIEEIKDSDDSPEHLIFELMFKKVFSEHPLSNSVLGEKDDIRKVTREKVSSFFRKWYKPERIVISASGYLTHDDLLGYLEPYCRPEKTSSDDFFVPFESQYNPISYKFNKEGLFQTHMLLATQTFDYNDPRRYPLLILNVILGEGMSSILFQKLREEKGLVYQIFSFVDFFSDIGIFGIYLACDPAKIEGSRKAVLKEIKKLFRKGVSKRAVDEAKVRLKTKLIIGLESTSNRMMRLGRSEVYRRKIVSIDDIVSSINKVESGDVNAVIRDILKEDRISFFYVGDF